MNELCLLWRLVMVVVVVVVLELLELLVVKSSAVVSCSNSGVIQNNAER